MGKGTAGRSHHLSGRRSGDSKFTCPCLFVSKPFTLNAKPELGHITFGKAFRRFHFSCPRLGVS